MTEQILERLRDIHRRNPHEYEEVCSIIDAIRRAETQDDGGASSWAALFQHHLGASSLQVVVSDYIAQKGRKS